jgi:nucleotide-binding universal stress UspA family protein
MAGRIPTRILVGVSDTPAAFAAARLAIDLAAEASAQLRFVQVLGDGAVLQALGHGTQTEALAERRRTESASLLRHVAALARREGVEAETVGLEGDAAALLLAQARAWKADLVVLGRFDVHGAGQSYVGAVTRHVLEFAEVPVLIVPHRA